MQFGIEIFPTDYSIQPPDIARLVEQRGFESIWFPEHTHIPAGRATAYPSGGDLPERYWRSHDPFVALTAAAMVTTNLRLGTGICLVIERDPIVTAKAVASLDMLSGGRFLFGIGGGWNREEMADHGTDYRLRWRILRERVMAMKAIWTQDEAEFHGQYVDFDKMWSWPKPVQKPHPPVIMGGDGERTFDRVIQFADGWMPLRGRRPEGGTMAQKVAQLRHRAEDAGRDPDTISISLFHADQTPQEVDEMEEAGVGHLIYYVPSETQDKVEPLLDNIAKLIR